MKLNRVWLSPLVFVAISLAAGCGSDASDPAAAGGGQQSDGGGGSGGGQISVPALESISIEPTSVTLNCIDGSTPSQQFTVTGHFVDGTSGVLADADYTLDVLAPGSFDGSTTTYTANGVIGGLTTLTASAASDATLSASAAITVQLDQTLYPNGADSSAAAKFATLVNDAAREAGLVYPLDGAVMPQNVYPADLQWLRGAAGDIFRITLRKPHATVVAYLVHGGAGFNNNWLVDTDAWRSIAQTDPDDKATIDVDRWDTSQQDAVAGAGPIQLSFPRAALSGTVYYWDIDDVRIKRIDDGTGIATSFMPSPPAGIDGNNCVGCHSVSNSGRYMAGRLGGGQNIGAIFDLTKDLTGNPPPTEYPLNNTSPSDHSLTWWDSSWSPDDSRLVIADNAHTAREIKFYDPFAGTEVMVTGSLPSGIQPSWSPDGKNIAFVSDANNAGTEHTAGNISTLAVVGADVIGATTQRHLASSLSGAFEGGAADSHPTWTPDSKHIVFAHGTGVRSELAAGKTSALYIMGPDGSNVTRLDKASGGSNSADTFQPNFSPFDQGGYYWVVYLSRRDYGNALAGSRGSQRQQLWVSAIKKGSQPGADPSSVGYWLPGQDVRHKNISAFYAAKACRPDGETCAVNSECCGGDCRANNEGQLVCTPPPPERCRQQGETCSTSADCCNQAECSNNVCTGGPR